MSQCLLRVSYLLLLKALDVYCPPLLIVSWLHTPQFYGSPIALITAAFTTAFSKLQINNANYAMFPSVQKVRKDRNKYLGQPLDKPECWKQVPLFRSIQGRNWKLGSLLPIDITMMCHGDSARRASKKCHKFSYQFESDKLVGELGPGAY